MHSLAERTIEGATAEAKEVERNESGFLLYNSPWKALKEQRDSNCGELAGAENTEAANGVSKEDNAE